MFDHGHDGNFVKFQYGSYGDLSPNGLWAMYAKFAESVKNCVDDVRRSGATVILNFKKDDLEQIVNFEVFTLFAHYDKHEDQIDLFDEVMSKHSFSEAFPVDFKGILDLSVCNATFIRNTLRQKIGNQIISFHIEVPIIQLLLLYKQVIRNLTKYEINYIDCYTQTLNALKNEKPKTIIDRLSAGYRKFFKREQR